MSQRQTIAVIGGGSFGTVVANMLADNGHKSILWMRNVAAVAEVNDSHENSRYLPGYKLNKNLTATSVVSEALSAATLVFIAIPSKSFQQVMIGMKPLISTDHVLISTTKGIEQEGFKLMSQVLSEHFPNNSIGVLSGPNLAKEIVKKQPAATVIASECEETRERVQAALGNSYFRIYASPDMYGVELGGALKNIYAIITGMAAALGMGENTKSLLITRSLAEMSRFAVQLGANPLTFLGLAGVGDLIVTCMSPLSRNYRIGFAIGHGKPLDQAIEEIGEVAEGVNTLKLVKEKADELDIYMPLVTGLYQVIFNGADVAELARNMMLAQQNSDVDFILARK